jgi:hypothetical protein
MPTDVSEEELHQLQKEAAQGNTIPYRRPMSNSKKYAAF